MTPTPPRGFARLLARAVRNDPAGPAILGDLHEDFVARARRRGLFPARLWYRAEVTLLLFGRALRAIGSSFIGNGFMSGLLRPDGLGHDVRSAFRTVRRAPAAYVLLALVMGLGVGATTAVYSVVRPLLLAPLPFAQPERLVWIENTGTGGSLSSITSRSSNLRDYRERSRSFAAMTGYNAFFDQESYTLMIDGRPEQTMGAGVAYDFLDVLGVTPVLGRNFTPEEGAFNGPGAILLSHGFWQRRFNGDPSIVGTSVVLDNVPHEVVGVLPASLDFASLFTPGVRVDYLLPFPVSDETDRWGNTMFFIGRLRPGVSPSTAEAELLSINDRLLEEQPNRWGLGALVTPLQAHIAAPLRSALLLLIAAAVAVMLIVCVNVANILLARGPGRAREVAVKKALGATRGRIVRQMLFESLLVAAAGSVTGLVLAVLATRFVSGTRGMAIPMLDRIGVNPSALGFALAAATLAGLLAGLVPALQVAEGAEADTMRAAGRGMSAHRAGRRLRELLVIAELAIACALLVAGGLLLRSFQAITDVDLGFESANRVAWQLKPGRNFDSYEEMSAYYRALADRVRTVTGVEAVGLTDALPLGKNRTWGFRVTGQTADDDRPFRSVFPHMIDAGYLEAMGIPLVAGRDILPTDVNGTTPVILVNEAFARTVFPGEDAIGRHIDSSGDAPWEIVGVVANVHHLGAERDPGFEFYFPLAQMWSFSGMEMVVESRLPPAAVAAGVSAALAEFDPAMPTRDFWTLEDTRSRSLSARRFTLEILAAFGAVALLLAALGVYGVLSQNVAERKREIGIRMTLGATSGSVRRAVVGRTLLLAAAGIGLGLLIALAGARLVSSLLYGVPATDPVTLASIAAALLCVAGIAGFLPALRASGTSALTILRGD